MNLPIRTPLNKPLREPLDQWEGWRGGCSNTPLVGSTPSSSHVHVPHPHTFVPQFVDPGATCGPIKVLLTPRWLLLKGTLVD